jgi:hypothetical protein
VSASILNSVKKNLGLAPGYTAFDADVIMYINSVFSTLNQLGIGPDDGYMIEDDTAEWDTFLGNDPKLNNVKVYVYLCVRLLFDPPTMSYLVTALEKQKEELEWRINVRREDAEWTDPNGPGEMVDGELVLDGGIP